VPLVQRYGANTRGPKRNSVPPCTLPLGSTCKLSLWEKMRPIRRFNLKAGREAGKGTDLGVLLFRHRLAGLAERQEASFSVNQNQNRDE